MVVESDASSADLLELEEIMKHKIWKQIIVRGMAILWGGGASTSGIPIGHNLIKLW